MLRRVTDARLGRLRPRMQQPLWRLLGTLVQPHATHTPTQAPTLVAESHAPPALPETCPGCGVALQSTSPDGLGYCVVPESAPSRTVCQRCFQAQHYGKLVPVAVPYEHFRGTMLDVVRRVNSVLVVVMDATDFHGSFIPDVAGEEVVKRGKDVVVVVNKCDLLPGKAATTHRDRLLVWVRTELKRLGLRGSRSVHLVSAQTGMGVKGLLEDIKSKQHHRDVYVVGTANAGKSTLVNRMLSQVWGWRAPQDAAGAGAAVADAMDAVADAASDAEEDEDAGLDAAISLPDTETLDFGGEDDWSDDGDGDSNSDGAPPVDSGPLASLLPGTTLGVVSTPFVGRTVLHDTPGVVVNARKQAMFEELSRQGMPALRQAVQTKGHQVTTFRLAPGRTLFLGGLFRLDLHSADPRDSLLLTWFGELPAHLTRSDKANDRFERHAGGLLAPHLGPLDRTFDIALKDVVPESQSGASATHRRRHGRQRVAVLDIVLSGLGWLAVTPIPVRGMPAWNAVVGGVRLTGATFDAVDIHLRAPLLPYETMGTRPRDWVV